MDQNDLEFRNLEISKGKVSKFCDIENETYSTHVLAYKNKKSSEKYLPIFHLSNFFYADFGFEKFAMKKEKLPTLTQSL